MPAAGTVWWCGDGKVDLAGGASANGLVSIEGYKADEALVSLLVASFDALTGLSFRAQEMGELGWEEIDPPLIAHAPATTLRFLDVTSGVKLLAAAVGQVVQIRVPLSCGSAFRFGVTPGDAGTRAAAAVTGAVRLVGRYLYA